MDFPGTKATPSVIVVTVNLSPCLMKHELVDWNGRMEVQLQLIYAPKEWTEFRGSWTPLLHGQWYILGGYDAHE
jgi:hypothetical protein